ncbi:MAG: exopolysaccharide biosynthesis polyprenyl glycosylphosphotransferase [Saprospiraceae bacterium]|jgi:exopolysaccharide biosynthesis polyprenyl glycosylphosphotransferase
MSSLLQKLTSGFASKLCLLVTDVVGLVLMFKTMHELRVGTSISILNGPIWVIILIALITLYVMDVYRTEEPITRARLPLKTFLAVPVAAILTTLFVYALGISAFMPIFGRGVMPTAFLLFSFWAAGWRWLLTWLNQRYQPSMQWTLLSTDELISPTLEEFGTDNVNVNVVIDVTKLEAHKLDWGVDENDSSHRGIVIGTQDKLNDAIASRIMKLRFSGVKVMTLSQFSETYWSRVPVLYLKDGWFAQANGFTRIHDQVGLRFQRIVDIVASSLGLVLFFPILTILGIFIRVGSKGKVFYSQTRVGLYGAPFTIYKLRTMVDNAEIDGAVWASVDDERITPFGQFLRQSRLDEWPQLWNVFKGEMSLIGPRPERPEFVEKLKSDISYYDLRHFVPPGITGWAQVMYRYGSSVEDARRKLEYDLYYIKNHSIQLDFAILVKTAMLIFKRAGR